MSLLLLMDDAFSPRSLFAAGEQGSWYDPSDFSSMFQDSAGTTPVTALGQPVGLALDKSKGLVLGPERRQDFVIGLVGTAQPATYNPATGQGSSSRVDASNVSFIELAGLPANKFFLIRLTNTGLNNLNVRQQGGGTIVSTLTAGQTLTTVVSTATFNDIRIQCAVNSASTTFTLLSARELPGNHAYQTTAASRQTAQSNYLSLDKTDDHLLVAAGGAGTTGFLLACGIVVPAAGTARTIFSDRGTNAGYSLSIDTANKLVFSGGTGAAFTTLTSAAALTTGKKYAVIAWHDGTNLNLSINNVPETPVACGTVTAGTSSFTIGKDNGAASGYWGDRLYSMVYRKNDTSNAGNRSNLFSYLVGKMGGL